MRASYRQPINLVVVYWPRDGRWRAWDNAFGGIISLQWGYPSRIVLRRGATRARRVGMYGRTGGGIISTIVPPPTGFPR